MFGHYLCSIYGEAYLPLHTPFNSLIKPSHIVRLVAQTSIVSIHGHVGIQDSLREIIDVDEEKKRAKT